MPDPDEALSILSSPAPGLPFLWLFNRMVTAFLQRKLRVNSSHAMISY